MPSTNKPLCFAHRGASGHEPENTLLAVQKALSLGAPWIEVDVYAVENQLIVIHDPTLERTTNGSGQVMGKTLSYLRSLDAGKGQKIPLLREIFDLVSDKAGINVELKGPNTAEPAVSLIDEYIMNHHWDYDRVLVSSFNHDELTKVKAQQPKIRIGALISKIPENGAQFAEALGAYSVHVKMKVINRQFVDDAHQRNLKVFVYTVNSPEEIETLRSLSVDGIFTNYPELLK